MLTGLTKYVLYLTYPLLYLVTKNCNQGAQTSIYGVFEDKDKLINGEHYADCKVAQKNPETRIKENQKKLWEISEQLLGIKFNV